MHRYSETSLAHECLRRVLDRWGRAVSHEWRDGKSFYIYIGTIHGEYLNARKIAGHSGAIRYGGRFRFEDRSQLWIGPDGAMMCRVNDYRPSAPSVPLYGERDFVEIEAREL